MINKSNQLKYEKLSLRQETIIQCDSEPIYIYSLQFFKIEYSKFLKIQKHVEDTILGLVKEKVASIWTKVIIHIGNTTIVFKSKNPLPRAFIKIIITMSLYVYLNELSRRMCITSTTISQGLYSVNTSKCVGTKQ